MTLLNKVIVRLENIGLEVVKKINAKIQIHDEDSNAHNSLFSQYVEKTNKSNHDHGTINKDGKVTQVETTASNVSKILVASSDGTTKVIDTLPLNKVTHQDISGKLDKLQTGHNGKFLKVNSQGEIEPEAVTIPSINVVQTKTNGVKIGSIKGIDFFCNENTTYENASETNPGLMSKENFTKLKGIDAGAKSVTFTQQATDGTKVGILKIGNEDYQLYSGNSTASYGLAQQGTPGLIEYEDVQKIKGVATGATKTEVTGTLSSSGATKIGTVKITDNSDISSIDLYTPNYTAANGLSISNRTIGHSNSKIAKRTTASLCKITYDEYGHITAGEAINADNLYASKGHDHNTEYAPLTHNHDDKYSLLGHTHGGGWEYYNFTNGSDSFTQYGITFRILINKELRLGHLVCSGTCTSTLNKDNKRVYPLNQKIDDTTCFPIRTEFAPIHAMLNLNLAIFPNGDMELLSDSTNQKDRGISGGILYRIKGY